jgi:L-threonylcarbamoyladenylate synthase
MTRLLATDDPAAIQTALDVVRQDGLIILPTDTVYGVGCLARRDRAVRALYQVKGRPEDKPIPILVGRIEDVGLVAEEMPEAARQLAQAFWPGPLTLVVLRQPWLPGAWGGETTVGVRVPGHDFTRRLLAATGPMAVTSANLSGEAPAQDARQAQVALGDRVALILDDGPSPGGQPSTVVDCSAGAPKILRAGPISEHQIGRALS